MRMKQYAAHITSLALTLLCLVLLPVRAEAAVVDSGSCGENVTWTLTDDGTLTISGTGEMESYGYTDVPWYSRRASITGVTIGHGVTSISDHAFRGCTGLTSVTIPDSVTSIGEWAFTGCDGLTSITIPAGVTTIGEGAFVDCDNLTGIWVAGSNQNYSSDKFGVLFNKNMTTLLCAPRRISGSYTIPDSVISLSDFAFCDCTGLSSVTIPDGIESIGCQTFYNCDGLTSVTIPDSVISIATNAFSDCDGLTSITIPGSVADMGIGVFSDCDNLTDVTIGKGVTGIRWASFSDCTRLTSVTLPDSITWIGEYAFSDCTSLTSITIPETVEVIEFYAFAGCTSLTDITVSATVWDGGFWGCTSLTSAIIFDGAKFIDLETFSGCSELTAVFIPASISRIEDRAFYGCDALSHVFYSGTREQWADIILNAANDGADLAQLLDCHIIYEAEPEYYYADQNCYYCAVCDEFFDEELREVGAKEFFTITFNANGGTVSPGSKTAAAGEAYGTLPVPTWSGHTFAGWYTSARGGSVVTSSSTVKLTSDQTLYAHWTGTAEDAFRFSNSSPNFRSNYTISNSAFADLTQNETLSRTAYIRTVMQSSWSGSCFGMSAVYALAHRGELDTTDFQSNAWRLYDLNIPKSSNNVNDLIGFYHLMQLTGAVNPLRAGAMDYDEEGEEQNNLKDLIRDLDSGGYVLMGVSYMADSVRRAGHAIVATTYTQDNSGNYIVQIWDPNHPSEFNELKIAADYSTYSFESPLTTMDTFITYSLLPEEYNQNAWEGYALNSGNAAGDCSILVTGDTDFRVESSDGSYAVFADGLQVDGDLVLTDVTPETGADSGIRHYAFDAGADSVITVMPSIDGEQKIALVHEDTFATVEASEIAALTVSKDSVRTDCDSSSEQTITLVSGELGENWNSATLTGKDTGFSLEAENETIRIASDHTVTVTVVEGNVYTDESSDGRSVESNQNGVELTVAEATVTFTDVSADAYYYDAVLWAVRNNITAGTSATKFSPAQTCTRGQVVSFLWRAAGSPEPVSNVNPFSDVKPTDYYYKAVLWAVENGITAGTSETKFSPGSPCTRGQVATFLWRAKGFSEPASNANPFNDVKPTDYYYKAVLWAVENDVTSGVGDGRFAPASPCTRGQIVTFLYRAMN